MRFAEFVAAVQVVMEKFFRSPPSQGIVLGLFFQILGDFLHSHTWHGYHNNIGKVGLWVIVLGTIMILVGCFNYVRQQGLNKWLSALGLFSLPGVIVLWVLVRFGKKQPI